MAVGRNKGKFLDEVDEVDPRYAIWLVSLVESASGNLLEFQSYLAARNAAVREEHVDNDSRGRSRSPPLRRTREDRAGLGDDEPLRLPNECVICCALPMRTTFVPCGHMVCCVQCSSRLGDCPICRQSIRRVMKSYGC